MVPKKCVALVLFAFLVIYFPTANSLECFTCSSQIGVRNYINECETFSYYDNHKKSMCMHGDAVCAKYIVNHDGMTWVHRSCQPYDICSYLAARYSNERNQLLECSTCSDRNLCNSSENFYPSIIITSATVALAKILSSW